MGLGNLLGVRGVSPIPVESRCWTLLVRGPDSVTDCTQTNVCWNERFTPTSKFGGSGSSLNFTNLLHEWFGVFPMDSAFSNGMRNSSETIFGIHSITCFQQRFKCL